MLTLTLDDVTVVGNVAGIGKVVGCERQRTCADETVAGRSDSGVTMVTRLTLLAVLADGVVLAVEALTADGVAGGAVVVALAWDAEAAERTRLGAEVARGAILARRTDVVGWAVALLDRNGHFGAG